MKIRKPQWQKACVIRRPTVYTHLYKKWIYVRADARPKNMAAGRVSPDGPRAKPQLCYETNLESWTGKRMAYPITCIELGNEFAFTNIPPVPFPVWSAPEWPGIEEHSP